LLRLNTVILQYIGKTKRNYKIRSDDGTDASTRTRLRTILYIVLNSSSNNADFNTIDPTRATDEQSSYISISGVGLTLGLKYSCKTKIIVFF
jgi:hypothetical protein